jgi:hypothetical protein
MSLAEEEYILKWNDHKNNFFSLMTEDLFQQVIFIIYIITIQNHNQILNFGVPYFYSKFFP